ncbi:MAG: hypothetical protein K6T17_01185 [Fimbriimonadales bacterium]|nr:hypothetical protein [Fimbriimonadales bacterium]
MNARPPSLRTRRQRGSALGFVIVLLLASTTVVLATAELATHLRIRVSRIEQERGDKYITRGLAEVVRSEIFYGVVSLPVSKVYSYRGQNWHVTADRNDANVKNTLRLTLARTSGGETITYQMVVPKIGSWFDYALASNTAESESVQVRVGTVAIPGDCYINGNVSFSHPSSRINGDLECTGSLTSPSLTVTGRILTSSPGPAFPALNWSAYYSAADRVIDQPGVTSILTDVTFLKPDELVFVDDDLDVSGIVSGRGTLFVRGNVTITGPLMYLASSSSRLAIIATGRIRVEANTAPLVSGYFFSARQFHVRGGGASSVTLTGGVVANDLWFDSPITIHYDPTVRDDRSVAVNLKLPGFWP